MPLCVCDKLVMPEAPKPLKVKSPVECEGTIMHRECKACGGFNLFIWDGDGNPEYKTDRDEFLKEAKAFNAKYHRRMELRRLRKLR